MSEGFCNTNHLDLWEVGVGLIGAAQEAQECRQHSHALHCSWCGDTPQGGPLAQAHGEADSTRYFCLDDACLKGFAIQITWICGRSEEV